MFSSLRMFRIGCGIFVLAAGLVAGTEPAACAQEPAAKSDVARDQKLDDVLKRIDDLRRQVEALRNEAAQPAGSSSKPAVKSDPPAATDGSLPAEWVKALKWRPIGPAGMGGRITDLSVFEADPSTYWIATASGGLLKTVNNGGTFEHQFDHEATVSLGAVCVAPSNKDIVWVGTGENNPRNSVSYGDGVYKSTDGGKKWTKLGLDKTYQIGRIVIHPTNPDIVYVGALGRLYGPNEQRGLFKTTDGGKTWWNVLYIDDKTGVIEFALHPTDPETLIVATWERQRDEFDSHRGDPPVADGYDAYDPIKKWGPGSGLHKSTDGGRSWKKLTNGLPSNNLGRMDVEYYRKDPNIVYAIIDCEKIGMGTPPSRVYLGVVGEDGGGGAKLTQVTLRSPAAKAELKPGDVIKSIDKQPITKYADITASLRGHQAGDKLTLEVVREEKTLEITVTLEDRPLGAGGAAPVQAYLGIQGEDAADGAKLTQITEGGPAAKAELKVGDVIKSVDKDAIASYEQLTEIFRSHSPGDKLALEVLRDDKTIEITATLEERPAGQFGGPGGGGGRGGRSGPGAELAQLLGAVGEDVEGGVKLARVFEERAADKAKLEEGDIVTEIDGVKITGVQQLVELLRDKKDGDKLAIKVSRGAGDKQEVQELALVLESPGGGSRTRPWTFMYAGQQPNVQDRQGPNSHEYGGIYKSTDGGESWTRINSLNPRPMYFSQIRVDPSDDKYLYILGVQLHRSRDGGKLFTADGGRGVHADQHALWIDPRDGRHMIVGCDGGFYATYDRMTNWEHLNHVAIGQFYHVAVDNRQPYRVYGGLQDNGSWGGPSRTLNGGGPINEDWISVGSGDGFVCRVDPFDPDVVYFESQNGTLGRRNLRTGERASIRPRPQRGQRYRFNWNTPFILSNHNPGIFYAAGNYVFRSVKRGDDLRAISPDLARTGRGTGTALAESPRNSDVLWVGTDDGNLWVTRDGGAKWINVAEKVGLPGPRWVATVEPSRFVDGRCYVAFDAHRSNDDEPYVYVTEDFGETWKSLRANLPVGSTRCLREDLRNPTLLYCGTEFACWASLDRGAKWTKLNNNLPTVAIHELALHPTANEMVAATHGRSLWVLDVTPLRQMTPAVVAAPVHLYEPNSVVRWRLEPTRSTSGGVQRFVGENPNRTAQIFYSLAQKPEQLSLKITDVTGATVRELETKLDAGLQVATWDLARITPRAPGAVGGSESAGRARTVAGRRTGGEPRPDAEGTPTPQPPSATTPTPATSPPAATTGAPRLGGGGGPSAVSPGLYRIVLTVDGVKHSQTIKIVADPTLPADAIANDEADVDLAEQDRRGKMPAAPKFIDD